MSYAIAVSKYSAAVNASEVLEIDFGGAVPSNPSTIFFLNDFLSPETIVENNKILSSELIIKIKDKDELKIVKDYTNKTVKFLKNGVEEQNSFFKILSSLAGSEFDLTQWTKFVVDCVKNNIVNIEQLKAILSPVNSGGGDLQALIAQADEGLSDEEKKKLNKLRDTEVKILSMDKEVSSYQNQKKGKEEQKKNKDKIESDIKALDDKLANVNMLIESQNRLTGELEKFISITSDNSIGQKVQKIKDVRAQSLHSSLKTARKAAPINMEVETEEKPLLVAKWMLGLVALELAISLILFVVSFQLIQLLIGIFSAATIIILMLLVNVNKYSKEFSGRFNQVPVTPILQSLNQAVNPEEDKLILNTAWTRALEGELKLINDSIALRLDGKSLEEMAVEKERLLSEKKKLEDTSSSEQSSSTSTEEYYKKRRELDILKIEKENIEFGLEGKIKKELEVKILELKGSQDTTVNVVAPTLIINCNFLDQITEFIEGLKKDRQVILINF